MMTTLARGTAGVLWLLACLAVLMFLRTASEMLIPIAIAGLISCALAPLVRRLQRARVPTLLGAAIALTVLFGGAGWLVYALRADIGQAVAAVPLAIRQLDEWMGLRAISQAEQVLRSSQTMQQGARWILSGAGHLTVVVFLSYFLLISGEHFKRRLMELAGPHLERRRITLDVLNEINDQIQRYLLVVAFTSGVVGVATWGALVIMGVQQAAVWGILAGVFNSIPYFGAVIVSGGLFAVGLLQFGEPMAAVKLSAIALAITSLEGWLLSPLLLGKAEQMHVLVVFVGVLVWTWLWGGWGALLAVPMLVVIKAIADHVESFKPISRRIAR
jgi:predicted PurR-regulated permease PerM